jgi:lactate 2-monooxygenase
LDAPVTGWRPRDLKSANFPELRGHVMANYTSDPVFQTMLGKAAVTDRKAVVQHWVATFGKELTWADMPWLRSITKLPLILKGICHPDDALFIGGHHRLYRWHQPQLELAFLRS